MKWTVIFFLTLLAPQDQGTHEKLKPIGWLVGKWEGKGKYGEASFTETATYSWTLNRNFLKFDAEAKMGGKVVYASSGMLGWDRDKKRLVMFSFAFDGTIGTGDEIESKDKDTWVFSVKIGSTPPWNDARSLWKKLSDDKFEAIAQKKEKGEWVDFFKGTYTRVKMKGEDR